MTTNQAPSSSPDLTTNLSSTDSDSSSASTRPSSRASSFTSTTSTTASSVSESGFTTENGPVNPPREFLLQHSKAEIQNINELIKEIIKQEQSGQLPAIFFELTPARLTNIHDLNVALDEQHFKRFLTKLFILFSARCAPFSPNQKSLIETMFVSFALEKKLATPFQITPLHYAANHQNLPLLELLFEVVYQQQPARIITALWTLDDDQMTVFHYAAYHAHNSNHLNREFFSTILRKISTPTKQAEFLALKAFGDLTAADILADSEDSTLYEEYQELVTTFTTT